jgi:hypothetical protein
MYMFLYCADTKEVMCHTITLTKAAFKPYPSVCATSKKIMHRVTPLPKTDIN